MLQNDEIQDTLAGFIADAMYMSKAEIGEDELFSNFGLESATLAKIVTRINQKYGRDIEVREVIPHQTLREASTYIQQRLNAHLSNGVLQ